NGLTAHYYIWGGGSNIDDEIEEYKADIEWNPGNGPLTLYAGAMAQSRIKTITADEMPFGEQCAYCDSDRALPASLFSPTNRYFFSGGGGNTVRDWLIYDPRALVQQVDQFATADGRAFNPAVFSPSGSSVVNEKVYSAYAMAAWQTQLGGMDLAVNV